MATAGEGRNGYSVSCGCSPDSPLTGSERIHGRIPNIIAGVPGATTTLPLLVLPQKVHRDHTRLIGYIPAGHR